MIIELISVGTEILLGNIVNTNAAYLSEKCATLGCTVYRESVVGDNAGRLEEEMRQALKRADVIILSGGLGPTKDDITKEVAAGVFGRKLVMDEHTKDRIQKYFDKKGQSSVTENNWKQAMIPEGAVVIDNDNGTAPGIIIEDKEINKTAILLPGPPNELIPMFDEKIAPYLNGLQPEVIFSYTIKICGLSESLAETMVEDLMENQTNPTIAPYAKTGEVHFRVTGKAETKEKAKELMAPVVKKIIHRFEDFVFAFDEKTQLEDSVVRILKARNKTVTTAESCTGGLLSGRIINVAGASEVFNEGYITYANESKEKLLGVKHETLVQYGAVSEQTAAEMALGAAKAAGADAALSITGIAGPDGGTEEKPVGLVYIGCVVDGNVKTRKFVFTGNREKNRENAVVCALTFLREELLRL